MPLCLTALESPKRAKIVLEPDAWYLTTWHGTTYEGGRGHVGRVAAKPMRHRIQLSSFLLLSPVPIFLTPYLALPSAWPWAPAVDIKCPIKRSASWPFLRLSAIRQCETVEPDNAFVWFCFKALKIWCLLANEKLVGKPYFSQAWYESAVSCSKCPPPSLLLHSPKT